jgi:hypothetical protein
MSSSPLNVVSKSNPMTGAQPAARRAVHINPTTPSAARAEALKARLSGGSADAGAPSAVRDASPSSAPDGDEAAAQPPRPHEPVSPHFAALARKEKQVRQAQQELKSAQQAWQQEQGNFISREQLVADPMKVLSELGIDYNKIVEFELARINPDPNQALLDKIVQLEGRLSKVDDTFKQRDDIELQAALKQIRSDVDLLVDSDAAYETIKATGAAADVVELIRRVFDQDGTVMPLEEAARAVEGEAH